MLGQHMFRRLHTRTEWDNLFCCGESTVMGTGTPTVTTSGLTAANAVLRKLGREPFVYRDGMKNYVRLVDKPFTSDRLYETYDEPERTIMRHALRCRLCEHPSCTHGDPTDIRGIMRRVAVGNWVGAKKRWIEAPVDSATLERYEANCICARENGDAVPIREVVACISEVNA